MPILSVIVPCYNSSRTLASCLEAIKLSAANDTEIIVIDDGSTDNSAVIAEKYADKLIRLKNNLGKSYARKAGIDAASGEVIVNIDSDVIIQKDTLNIITRYFADNPETDAVTGLLAKKHPHKDFFSQYKNLYMHYIFKRLPEKVNFLFGSICAVRRKAAFLCDNSYRYCEDTAYGQQLATSGRRIVFLSRLEVRHLKKYNFFSLLVNDLRVPFDWANIFLKFKGWKQLGKNKVGFIHAPAEQLVSVTLAPLIVAFILLYFSGFISFKPYILLLIPLWLALNMKFLSFLLNEKGLVFFGAACLFTFLDNIIMFIGIAGGVLSTLISNIGLKISAMRQK